MNKTPEVGLMLQALPLELLYLQFSDPNVSIDKMAAFYGVSAQSVAAVLRSDPAAYAAAQALKAQRLSELALQNVSAEPPKIIDAAGNERIDPAGVALMKLRADFRMKVAGILDKSLSERAQVEVNITAAPLAQWIKRINEAGSSIPISQPAARATEPRTIDAELVENVDNSPLIHSPSI